MKSIYLFIATILTFSFNACTIDKRLYRSGYHVQWNLKDLQNDKNETGVPPENENNENVAREENNETPATLEASVENSPVESSKNINAGKTEVEQITQAVKQNKKTGAKTVILNENQHKEHKKGGAMGLIGGLFMIILAVLLLGLGLIFSNVLGVAGVVFLIIFLIAAVMLFIAGIVRLFIPRSS